MSLRSARSQRGQTLVEYALAITLIAIVSILAMLTLGGTVSGIFTSVNSTVSSTGNGGGGGGGATPTPTPGALDSDGDGLDDPTEGTLGTDPGNKDTDDDGHEDGDEVNVTISDPLDPSDPGTNGLPITPDWVRSLSSSAYSEGYGLSTDASGSVFAAAVSGNNAFFREYTAGNVLGDINETTGLNFGQESWRSSAVDAAGNIYVSKQLTALPSVRVVKFNPAGSVVWTADFTADDGMGAARVDDGELATGPLLDISPDGLHLMIAGRLDENLDTFEGVSTGSTDFHLWSGEIDMATGAKSNIAIYNTQGVLLSLEATNSGFFMAHAGGISFAEVLVERRGFSGSLVWSHTLTGDGATTDIYGYANAGHKLVANGGAVYVTATDYGAGENATLWSLDAGTGSENWRNVVSRDGGSACMDSNFVLFRHGIIYMAGMADTYNCGDTSPTFDAPTVTAGFESFPAGWSTYIVGYDASGAQVVDAQQIPGITADDGLMVKDIVNAPGNRAYILAANSNGAGDGLWLVRTELPTE